MGKKAEVPQAIVEGNHHHTFCCQAGRIILATAVAKDKGAAMNPHHHRQVLGVGRCVHVEVQAVFVAGCGAGGDVALRTDIAEILG